MEIFQITHKDEIKDQQIALVASFLSITLLLVVSYFITFSIYAPVPKDIPPFKSDEVIQALSIPEKYLELKTDGGLSGGGTATNDKLDTPKEQVQQLITGNNNINVKVNSGNSNKTNGNNTQNGPSTSHVGNNPFGSGGNGGGNGSGNGPFGGNGGGEGNGEGNGVGDGKNRVRLNDPKLPEYAIDFDSKINLKLTINANGDVVNASYIRSIGTTIDLKIINEVIREVIKQVHYKKDKDAGLAFTYLTVSLHAR